MLSFIYLLIPNSCEEINVASLQLDWSYAPFISVTTFFPFEKVVVFDSCELPLGSHKLIFGP